MTHISPLLPAKVKISINYVVTISCLQSALMGLFCDQMNLYLAANHAGNGSFRPYRFGDHSAQNLHNLPHPDPAMLNKAKSGTTKHNPVLTLADRALLTLLYLYLYLYIGSIE